MSGFHFARFKCVDCKFTVTSVHGNINGFFGSSSHAITADVSLEDTALAAELFLSDGVIVTGDATGRPANPQHVTG